MTTAATEQPDAPARKTWGSRRRRELGDHVAQTVASLQAQVLRDPPRPEAVSALARLRRGIGRTPGFDYSLETYLLVPDHLLGARPADDAEAADTEQAVHDAVTLYALHQQSRRERMHVNGQGLGHAMARLTRASTGPDGVRRRFAALGTASTYAEAIYHLRSLVTMLREHQIPLDYGLLSDDLRALRHPTSRARIQGAWGREYFRNSPGATIDTTEESTE
ncbi:type I-E CRISPR-associated protein Cse2/CasB [Dactylosporangium sp. NPDC006015]|uniref:type I-E CRISPR-associated protein Cse2/CasB n=1 Tax=Dactylosporangium sp. NPDC006015 TaxID=3154576 RepID=UPI00339E17D5